MEEISLCGPSDSPDLMIWPLLKSNVAKFVVIQTNLSCLFRLAVNFLGLRRNRASA
jgi:hypothetical protein